MDVNGTRFHLIKGSADWSRCCERERCEGHPDQHHSWVHAQLEKKSGVVTLKPLLSIFKHRGKEMPLDLSARRGAAADRFGNWYWISSDKERIFWWPYQSRRPSVFWSQAAPSCAAPAAGFRAHAEQPSLPVELSGLAITEHHYLVAGNRTERGVLIFDLDAGGEPVLLLFPEEAAFDPFDIAAGPRGGVWILDRANRTYWGLDRQFRLVVEPPITSQPSFIPALTPVGDTLPVCRSKDFPHGFLLDVDDPVSIVGLPDGSVLILDVPPAMSPQSASALHHYRLGSRESAPVPLEAQTEVLHEGTDNIETKLSIVGHDIAYTPHDKTLYVIERDGNQVIAFELDLQASPPQLRISRSYLPLHFFGGRSLVAHDRQVFYDVAGGDSTNDLIVRWMSLQAIDQRRFEREGVLFTSVLDGKERDCVWHRLFLDACIPQESAVRVWARAHNDEELLKSVPFVRGPDLYLRGAGAELPFYDPFPQHKPRPEGLGTWELLFQHTHGRYAQIKIEMSGNGRLSPRLDALRVYYPRFSYPKRYLPAAYLEDRESASFLERMLANTEGFFTEIEGKVAEVSLLFDGRSAPGEALDWLAGWLGLALDPLWASINEHRAEPVAAEDGAIDRRRLFIRFARKLYHGRGTPNGIKFALHLLLDPCLEKTIERFKNAAVTTSFSLRNELASLGLPYPTPTMSDNQIEDLVYEYMIAPKRPSRVRIVERFLTRGGRSVVEGDPSGRAATTTGDEIQSTAHRFSVLVPQGLSPDEEAMVRRIVDLEKPAHTRFDVGHYWEYFRVDETRLGLDTVLGEESRFVPVVLGRHHLSEGYLHPPNPMNVSDRVVSDRDRVGFLPPL